MKLLRREGFDFGFDPSACRDCAGRCCRGESGHIWVSRTEIEQIASHLQCNTIDFMVTYVVHAGNRLSLREKETGSDLACVFFDLQACRCTVYPVRPSQCRHFPFWTQYRSNRTQLSADCPGIRVGR